MSEWRRNCVGQFKVRCAYYLDLRYLLQTTMPVGITNTGGVYFRVVILYRMWGPCLGTYLFLHACDILLQFRRDRRLVVSHAYERRRQEETKLHKFPNDRARCGAIVDSKSNTTIGHGW